MPDSSKQDFDKANPEYLKDLQGDSAAIDRLQQIEREAQQERLNAAKTINEKRETWLNEERQKIAYERQQAGPTYDPPGMANKSIEQEAQERVSLRAQGLMAEAEANRTRKIEELTKLPHSTHAKAPEVTKEAPSQAKPDPAPSKDSPSDFFNAQNDYSTLNPKNQPKRRPAHPLKKETHQIVDRAQSVRIRAGTHFRKMRQSFIDSAQERGAENPVGEVYKNFVDRQKRIDRAEHRLLHQAFQRHGIDRAPVQDGPTNSGPSMQG